MTNYNEFSDFLDSLISSNSIQKEYSQKLSNIINKGSDRLKATGTSSKIAVTASNIISDNISKGTFIDLKPYFANSPKAKHTKDGGWYMVIPVGNHKAADLRSIYGRSVWDNISHMDFGETSSGNLTGSDLQNQLAPQNTLSSLSYTWKSANVTRNRYGNSGKRGTYNTFRTVSSKSDPMSWIIGRQNLSNDAQNRADDDMSAEELAKAIKTFITDNN